MTELQRELRKFDESRLRVLAGDDMLGEWAREGFMARLDTVELPFDHEQVQREAKALLP